MGWLKRLRTSYGFGVHSPFAFSLITDTLRLRGPYAYYAYSTLPDPTARLVYRVASRLNVARIDDFGSGYPLPDFIPSSRPGLRVAERESNGRRESAYSPTLYVISSGADISTLPQSLLPGDAVMLIDPDATALKIMNQAIDTLGFGMSFDARSGLFAAPGPSPYALYCLFPHLPRQHHIIYT